MTSAPRGEPAFGVKLMALPMYTYEGSGELVGPPGLRSGDTQCATRERKLVESAGRR